ncbi:hypothetical protein LINPERHAP1_LOCUS36319, partial [Linum perenne]
RYKHAWTKLDLVGVSDIVPACSNGIKSLSLSKGFKEKLCKPWSHSVVVRLLGKSIGYSYLCHRLRAMWKPTGNMHIVDLDKSCFLVKFSVEQDYFKALTGGSWILLDNYLLVHQWDPSFRVSNDLPKRMVAWIRFPHLPIHLYHGQQVEYENLSQLCFHYGLVGHERLNCPRGTDPDAPEKGNPASSSSVAIVTTAPAPAADSYGPWMLVSRRSRRLPKESVAEKVGTTALPRADNQVGSSKTFKAGGFNPQITESEQDPTIKGPTVAKSLATANEDKLVSPSGPGDKTKRKPKRKNMPKLAEGPLQPSTQDRQAADGPDAVKTSTPFSGLVIQVEATSPQPSSS